VRKVWDHAIDVKEDFKPSKAVRVEALKGMVVNFMRV